MEPKPQSGSGNLLGEDHLRLHSPGLTYGEVQAPRKEAEGRRVPPRAQHCRTPQDQGGKKHRAASSHSSRALTRTLPHSQHQNTPSQTMWDLPGWEFSINLVSTWLNANVKQWNWAGYSPEGRSLQAIIAAVTGTPVGSFWKTHWQLGIAPQRSQCVGSSPQISRIFRQKDFLPLTSTSAEWKHTV